MNIDICKKHLVGKPVAFTAGNLNTIYRGVIADAIVADVIEDAEWQGYSIILVPAEAANFCHVRIIFNATRMCHSFKLNEEVTNEPMCEEPIIDGAIPFGSIMKMILREHPNVQGLIKEFGTFTGCKYLTDEFVKDGLIRKEGKVLHVNFGIFGPTGCVCNFTEKVEKIESVTRDLKKFFEADEIVYHLTKKLAEYTTMTEVDPGYTGSIRSVPGAHKGDPLCGTYPVIKGLGMKWVCEGKRE